MGCRLSAFFLIMNPKRVGFFVYDGVTALEFVGPIEAFNLAATTDDKGNRQAGYEIITIGINGKTVVSESRVSFKPDTTIADAPDLDTLVVPAGCGLRTNAVEKALSPWLKSRVHTTRRIVSVCTGIYGLASAGLLDGREATTHWRFTNDIRRRFPRIRLNSDVIFIKDGPFYTCSGASAGMDLSIALIEEDYGPKLAFAVARELVLYLRRTGPEEQYSVPLRFQIESTDRFSEIVSWVAAHLHQDISIDALAERASCSRRHFGRLFRQVFGTTPAHFVEELRLTQARQHLSNPRNSLKGVAASVGFKSVDAFSRAFERRFGIRPSDCRQHFQPLTRRNGKPPVRHLATAP
jgi:transcriptional regulator GlxA family with amidase domain